MESRITNRQHRANTDIFARFIFVRPKVSIREQYFFDKIPLAWSAIFCFNLGVVG